MLRVTIDNRPCAFAPGISVLDALRQSGIEVPHLCHDDRLRPYGACRLCVVEIEGEPRPVASCSTPLAEGMVIRTRTAELEALRRTNLELMTEGYPAEAVAREPGHPFHRLLAQYGVTALSPSPSPAGGRGEERQNTLPQPLSRRRERGESWVRSPASGRREERTGAAQQVSPLSPRSGERDRERGTKEEKVLFHDETHPYLGVDMSRCIHCYRCVRICDEVQGQFVWGVWQRGEHTHIAPRRGDSLLTGGCVACGACVDSCPSGALYDKCSAQAAEQWTRSTCVYCAVGCQMEVGSRDGRITQVKPALDGGPNRGHLCVKGRYAWDFVHSEARVTQPMLRESGHWRPVSWDHALNVAAEQLRLIVAKHGPDAVGVLGSARATNEENYLIQKFARAVLGTHNVDCCARVCHTPSAKALREMLGTGAATNSFDDIERAALIVLCGCNPAENHPVVGARIKQAVLKGAQLIVIDPRRTELAAYAELHLPLRPGGNLPLFNAMAATIVEEGLVDRAFLETRTEGYGAFADFIRAYAPEQVADVCGVPAADIRAAARLYATARPAMCFHGLGVTEHLQGTEGVMALVNLALLTGNLGREGAGINPLRGQNNVQGAAHMGCDPAILPGAQAIPVAGERFAAAWGVRLPQRHGLNLMQMLDAAVAGQLKALYVFGYDIYQTLAHAQATARALERLELVIVQDLFMNATAREFGTVFLPAASFLERDGTFMNSDRRVQRIRKVLPPPGEARPDLWIIQQLARRTGAKQGFDFADAEAVWDEVRRLWPDGAGLSYARLARESLHWPCPDEAHPGTPVLHVGRFAAGARARLRAIEYVPTPEQCDAEYPFLLNTGRTLYHFNAGNMTYRTPNAALQATDTLDMAPADAQRLGLRDGQAVSLRSRHGAARLPLRITGTVKVGELFTSFHRPELFVNRVTSGVRDRLTGAPEYKVTAVRVEAAD
jgi:formate dehydrogenase major subunit